MKRVIIYGFGEAGKQIAESIIENGNYEIIGFLDDDKKKFGLEYKNLRVLGDINDLKEIKKIQKIDTLIIAMPSASIERIREIELIALKNYITDIKVVPSIYVRKEKVFLKHVVDVDIFDIFKKRFISVNYEILENFYKGKTILITGGAGTIGSMLSKELSKFNIEKVVLMDIDETRLYDLEVDLDDKRFEIYLGDITDDYCLNEIFKRKFDIVIHTAAYKHVHLVEKFKYIAYKTNVIGTKKLVDYSKMNNIEKFIFISTDKAVEPISFMGKTKKIAENYVIKNKYTAIRFGNVINSRGSLIPTILRQIEKGYVKITHKDAKRYFITPKEAILLILSSVVISKGGEIFVLDMGEPVNIKNLIEKLIEVLGYKPYEDIKIIFTNLREGEKIEEKLIEEDEKLEKTEFEFIYKIEKSGEGGI
ncbi:MAG: polysaccharide biosynthesis protein [candidate division WOR-3 bacterium]